MKKFLFSLFLSILLCSTAMAQTTVVTDGEGIDTLDNGSTMVFSCENASDSNKGCASFDSSDFTVSSGEVSLAGDGGLWSQGAGTDIYYDDSVGIGTSAPSQALDVVGSIELEDTTSSTTGVIYKGGERFIHDFSYGDNGTVTPNGRNTFLGKDAGNFTIGSTATLAYQSSENVGIGYKSLFSNTTGFNNLAIGTNSLGLNTTGYHNTSIGLSSLEGNTTGIRNIGIGYLSGKYISGGSTLNTTSDYSIYIGSESKALADNDQNEIVIGYNATGIGSNTVTLGADTIVTTALKGDVGIGNTAPDAKLHVTQSTTEDQFIIEDSSGNTDLIVTDDGNVGIGTTNPTGALEVVSSDATSFQATDTDGDALFTVLSSGNVGIGTSAPQDVLDVNDDGIRFKSPDGSWSKCAVNNSDVWACTGE